MITGSALPAVALHLLFSTPIGAQMFAMAADEEADEIRLMAVCRPAELPRALAEVERRAATYTAWLEQQDRPIGYGRCGRCTPRAKALQSVTDDVAMGWLG